MMPPPASSPPPPPPPLKKPTEAPAPVRVAVWKPEDFADMRVVSTQSSIAGAGSGEFHTYRMKRKTEQERLQHLQEDAQKHKAVEEFERRQEERRRLDEERLNKNRSKRQRRKKKGGKASGGPAADDHNNNNNNNSEGSDQEDGGAVAANSSATAGSFLDGSLQQRDDRSTAIISAPAPLLRLVRGTLVSEKPVSFSPTLQMHWTVRADGSVKEWAVEQAIQSCWISVEGYLVLKFKDAGNEIRETVMDRIGDYALFTAQVPYRVESISATKSIMITSQGANVTKASFFSANASSQEGAFFAGQSSLATAGSLRKSFPAQVGWQVLGVGEQAKLNQTSKSVVVLVRGKLNVQCAGQTAVSNVVFNLFFFIFILFLFVFPNQQHVFRCSLLKVNMLNVLHMKLFLGLLLLLGPLPLLW